MANKVLVIIAAVALIVLVGGAVFVLKGGAGSSKSTPTPTPAGSGKLEVKDDKVGDGAEAKEGSSITVKYTGKLQDGTVFDSTEKQGGQPATFTLAKGQLIDGWVEGIPGMKVGGKRTLVIPPDKAYGERGNSSIPPNATLTFEIELLDVK